jgi:CMP-N-acetylneuraminic acid synthetase
MCFDYFALLQPTSPLRTVEHIRESVRLAVDENLASVVSFSTFETDMRLVGALPCDLSLSGFESPNDALRQDGATHRGEATRPYAGRLYRVNGVIYINECEAYERTKSFYGARSKAYVIDKKYAIDIDDEYDFMFAELLMKTTFS